MDLSSAKNIKEILAKYGAKPSKGLGQNFLIDINVLAKIIESANIKSSDTILEVGPGIGTLTQELAKKTENVVAVEKDEAMIEILAETLKDYKNVKIIHGDILKTNFQFPISNFQSSSNDSINKKYKVIANIPYYITAPLIRLLLENKNPPEDIVLLLQKEVAQRICSKPPDMSLLAVSVQFYAEPKIISYVSKNCFWPAPKVDSAIIKIIPGKKYNVNKDSFFRIAKAGFSQPRKQLAGNLSKSLKINKEKVSAWLLKNKINPTQRAETLLINDWKNLTEIFERI